MSSGAGEAPMGARIEGSHFTPGSNVGWGPVVWSSLVWAAPTERIVDNRVSPWYVCSRYDGGQTMPIPHLLETQLNGAVLGVHQRSNPLQRARSAGELIDHLQRIIDQLAKMRRGAVAEAVLRPNMSMAKVAVELNLSKSTVAKLAAPDVRDVVASEMTARLDKGYSLAPLEG